MSETIFRFKIDELEAVKLICTKCRTAIEMPIDRLAVVPAPGPKCPDCGAHFTGSQSPDPLALLGSAIKALKGNKAVEVEFTLPHKP
jgi:hypothetical protein